MFLLLVLLGMAKDFGILYLVLRYGVNDDYYRCVRAPLYISIKGAYR